MKFTEEQYHEIIKAWRRGMVYVESAQEVVDYLIDDMNVDVNSWGDKALAIANPLTRKWAHEQFVVIDKTKKYLWTTPLVAGIKYALIKENGKYVLSDMYLTGKGTPLTELEVVNIGLKTEWFNKEEVK